jgi:hypothetical protein
VRAQVAYAPAVPRFQVIHVWHAVARRHGAAAVREYGRKVGAQARRAAGYKAIRVGQ